MRSSGYSVSKIQRYGYLFILPALIFFCLFLIYPMLSDFHLSLVKWNLLGPKKFVGLKNYILMFHGDGRVLNSLWRTAQFSVISVVAVSVIAFAFAILFSSSLIRFKNLLQSIVFLPVVLSVIAVGVVWEYMFESAGLMSLLVHWIFHTNIRWLANTRVAPYAIIIVYVWRSIGYYMVIYIAGLLDVPPSLYESARIDGAGFFARLFYITLPMLRHNITLAVVSCVIFTFGQFPLQYVITQGGPSRSTEVLSLLIFREAFDFYKFGYSAAISVLFFVILLVFSLIQLRLFRSDTSEV